MLVAHASLTRSPFGPSSTASAGVVAVVLLGSEQEHTEFGAVQASGVGRMDLRSAHVLGRGRGDATVDVGESGRTRTLSTSDRLIVDAARSRSSIQPAVQLDVWTRCRQYEELGVRLFLLFMGEPANSARSAGSRG